ncbi:MAG: HipA domain-containing protein [Oscillospiraceae bacterium]|nr:HipA domain-containing protein [Oscillospiraceae bacterium]
MHKKNMVAELEIAKGTSVITDIVTLFNPEHLPVGISLNKTGKPDIEDINDWFSGRAIPASRHNIRAALQNMGVSSADKLITMCYGLSLSDQYWINPKENSLNWEDVNFFENDFSEDVGNALFGNVIKDKTINFVSPNNTSDGLLQKKWQIINGRRCLIKGGSDPFFQQPFNEVMASEVMRRLNIPCVDYSVIFEKNRPYSVCESFVNSKTELVSAFHIHNTEKIDDTNKLYNHYLKCCENLNIPNAKHNLDKMLTADYLIMNDDRHLSNFGAIRNAETLEWLGFAPNFDSGSSFCNKELTSNILSQENHKSQPFCQTHEEQIKLVTDFSWLDLSALSGIENKFFEILSASSYIDNERAEIICDAFLNRIKALEHHIQSQ